MKSTDIIGGCLCGSVRYTCDADPSAPHICHCKDCRKQSGTAFSMFIDVPREALQLSGRALKSYTNKGDSGGKVIRKFCDQCGSSVLGEVETHPDLIFINAGTLDNANAFEPEEEIWTQSKLAFATISGDIRSYARDSSG